MPPGQQPKENSGPLFSVEKKIATHPSNSAKKVAKEPSKPNGLDGYIMPEKKRENQAYISQYRRCRSRSWRCFR